MRSYFKEMYCNLDVKYKARRSKKEETKEIKRSES
jgi:hypothetical protein